VRVAGLGVRASSVLTRQLVSLWSARRKAVKMRASRRRSAGSVFTARDMLTVYRTGPREARQAGDVDAVNRGEVVAMFCAYRGTYGTYPRRFRGCWLDLTPKGLVIRPMLLLSFLWRRITVPERIVEAKVRPFMNAREALNWKGSGQYAAGGALEQAGNEVVSCHTALGLLEFAVHRPDVPLILHYIGRLTDDPR
jgi:hypothetical protein